MTARVLRGGIAALMLASGAASVAHAQTRVQFPSLDRDAAGAPIVLDAVVYEPRGAAPSSGFPAIVALHGCSGLWSAAKGREGMLSERNADWARHWTERGYVVVYPDSLRPRGLLDVCRVKRGDPTVIPYTRRLDALGALRWLASRPNVARDRIAVVGWSHGGGAALAAIDALDADAGRLRGNAGPPFRAAVAFYPGCRSLLNRGDRFGLGAPWQIHIGEVDDWTPASACVALGKAHAGRGAPGEVFLYPDSHHGFDAPRGGIRHLADVRNGVNADAGVHVGPNPQARALARSRVDAFLDRALAR